MENLQVLSTFSGVLYSSPEVQQFNFSYNLNICPRCGMGKWECSLSCTFLAALFLLLLMKQANTDQMNNFYYKLFSNIFIDKINQWGPSFREGYTRLGLLKPFLAENSGIFFFTATATTEDMQVFWWFLSLKNCEKKVTK